MVVERPRNQRRSHRAALDQDGATDCDRGGAAFGGKFDLCKVSTSFRLPSLFFPDLNLEAKLEPLDEGHR